MSGDPELTELTAEIRALATRAEAEGWDASTVAHELSHVMGPDVAGQILVRGLLYVLDMQEALREEAAPIILTPDTAAGSNLPRTEPLTRALPLRRADDDPGRGGPQQRAAAASAVRPAARRSRIIAPMFDVIIEGGDLIDGTGAAPRRADVGIAGGDITAVDDLAAAEAERRIDATGLTVAPGFIDTHTHTEGVLLGDPQHAMGLCQGITTEIFGLDGLSYAPLSRENYLFNRRYLAGLLGWPPEELDTSTVAAFRQAYHRTVAINTAYLAAHGAIRLEALGFRDAPLVGDPLDHARRLVRESIEDGAVGISSGLNYYPNAWCDTAELIELAKATRDAGSIHVIELRTANRERAFQGGGLAEAMEVGRRSGARIHIAHHRTQPWTAGQTDALLADAEAAKADGVDVSFDIYPYPSGSSYPLSYLPAWTHEGGPDRILERLADPDRPRPDRRAHGHDATTHAPGTR